MLGQHTLTSHDQAKQHRIFYLTLLNIVLVVAISRIYMLLHSRKTGAEAIRISELEHTSSQRRCETAHASARSLELELQHIRSALANSEVERERLHTLLLQAMAPLIRVQQAGEESEEGPVPPPAAAPQAVAPPPHTPTRASRAEQQSALSDQRPGSEFGLGGSQSFQRAHHSTENLPAGGHRPAEGLPPKRTAADDPLRRNTGTACDRTPSSGFNQPV